MGVSYGELLAEFEGPSYKGGQLDVGGTGDVKYHHGGRGRRVFSEGEEIDVSLAPNPSHLEFVNPVVIGMARSHQFDSSSGDAPPRHRRRGACAHARPTPHSRPRASSPRRSTWPRLNGYDVGGTIHIIVNNQVGFTTDPGDARSTHYASDLAKGYGIPVVHVNADDPEACLAAMRLAMAYRKEFGDDFVIDLVGYRRYGHNEGDEPAYTQPVLYRKIAEHPTVRGPLRRASSGRGCGHGGRRVRAAGGDLRHPAERSGRRPGAVGRRGRERDRRGTKARTGIRSATRTRPTSSIPTRPVSPSTCWSG